MKPHSNSISIVFPLILLAALVAGCTKIVYPPSTPSLVPTVNGTDVVLPSRTRIPSQTPLNTEIPTLTSPMTPTFTLIPTPLGQDARSKVAYLLKTNGNCSLPCWWGITPGQTTWSEAVAYINSFVLENPNPVSTGQDNLTFYPIKFPNPNLYSQDDYLFAEIAINGSGRIEYIFSSANTSLSTMLDNNGVPSQIWINIVTIGTGEYTIVLFYDTGMMLVYYGTNYGGNNQFLTICPEDIRKAISQLWVWDPATIRTFEDIGKYGLIPALTPNPFRPLQEVSDMQPHSFFDFYSKSSATECIKTPWSDWNK